MVRLRRWLGAYWQYVAGIVAAAWAVFIYFDSQETHAPSEPPATVTASRTVSEVAESTTGDERAAPASPAVVTATEGIAVGGNVTGSELSVEHDAR